MMTGRKIAVIAGTRVDTEMGELYLRARSDDFEIIQMPAAADCDEQIKFQYSSDEEKRAHIDEIFDVAIARGVRDFFIYCNSLSAAFDFDSYVAEKNAAFAGIDIEDTTMCQNSYIRVFTPLHVYRELGTKHDRIGVISANNLSAHAIEEVLMSANPDIYVIGTGNMSVVRAIENGRRPRDIVDECGLTAMLDYMKASGAEAVILGCTHFPYLKDELSKHTDLPLIDPADLMYESMIRRP